MLDKLFLRPALPLQGVASRPIDLEQVEGCSRAEETMAPNSRPAVALGHVIQQRVSRCDVFNAHASPRTAVDNIPFAEAGGH